MIGGGVIGRACALGLRGAGAAVVVVDPGEHRRQAGWAAGGMLAPLAEAPGSGAFLELAQTSLALFPGFVAAVEEIAGLEVGLELGGKVLTAFGGTDVEALRSRHEWQQRDGHPVEWLDGPTVRALEPAVSPDVVAGLLLRGNGRVDNRRLVRALRVACRNRGVRERPDRVVRLLHDRGRVRGVGLASGGTLEAPTVVMAAGAWSGTIEGLPRPLPVRPVRGQMLALGTPLRPLQRVVTSADAYLIPRETDDGPVVVVGATEEEAGFDLEIGEPGQTRLRAGAIRLVPHLTDAPVVERWAGLRPGSPDGLPILGPDPEMEGLCYATGHYRNGILLAPVTAERVTAWWASGDATGMDDAVRPERFGGGAGTAPAPPPESPAPQRG